MNHKRGMLAAAAAGLLFLLSPASALAQFPYPYPYPYYPYPGGLGPGYFLQGSASVINSVGNLYQQQEQARILREQANQAKLDTKKKTLDWLNYERENTWTYTQEQERKNAFRLRRIMNQPNRYEVVDGTAMNFMLPYLAGIASHGAQGPPVNLNQELLKQINVTGTTQGRGAGVLKDGGKVFWPLALRGSTTKSLDELLPKAVKDAISGNLELSQVAQINAAVAGLRKDAMAKWNKEEIDTSMYLEAKRFLSSLEESLPILRRPDASRYLAGGYAANGKSVDELVMNMTSQGLRFAPAHEGGETAYFAVFNAMVSFASGGTNDAGFRVRLNQQKGKY
jgi:hypothetical protein